MSLCSFVVFKFDVHSRSFFLNSLQTLNVLKNTYFKNDYSIKSISSTLKAAVDSFSVGVLNIDLRGIRVRGTSWFKQRSGDTVSTRGRESMLLLVDCDDPHVCTESYTVSVIYHTNYCYLTS